MEQLKDSASSLEEGEVPPVPANSPEASPPEGTGSPTLVVVPPVGLIKAVTQLFGARQSQGPIPPPPPPGSPP